MPSFSFGEPTEISVQGDLMVRGGLQVTTVSTVTYSKSEKALMDILPKIKETHPDLFLKYLDLIPKENDG